MPKRSTRAQTAQETVEILRRGAYVAPAGGTVVIGGALASARAGSVLYRPDSFAAVRRLRDRLLTERNRSAAIEFEVVNETTLHAARRLLHDGSCDRVLALNFASAKNPGGGFLQGSQAQEESLARASGLYACVAPIREMYDSNRRFPSCLYTDHMIYSPEVPVFRDDDDQLLDQPYAVSIITAPAVNAGVVRRQERWNLAQIEPTMLTRIEKVLSVAVLHGDETLVLGAWGCGVFANDPTQVASWFSQHLTGTGPFRSAFQKVVFAVLDRTGDQSTIGPFEKSFGTVR
jgi:uncharacterized protein (TIGR02452 family)